MDSKLEAHIDEIFIEVPKTDKMVTMINRIKSKANSKFLQIRDQGYSRSVAFMCRIEREQLRMRERRNLFRQRQPPRRRQGKRWKRLRLRAHCKELPEF